MSILIKGMMMPKHCYDCRFEHNAHCFLEDREVESIDRPEWCPIVEVQPHGKLIDQSELIKAINKKVDDVSENSGRGATIPSIAWFSGMSSALSIIENAPTVIEVEGQEK